MLQKMHQNVTMIIHSTVNLTMARLIKSGAVRFILNFKFKVRHICAVRFKN